MKRARIIAAIVSAIVSAILLLPSLASAQRCRGCETEDTMPRGHIWPALGLRVGEPQKASAAIGVVIGETWQKDGHEHARNLALFAEPGLSAGRATLAYVDHGYGSFGSGFGIGPTVMRTWRDPWVAQENATYAGAEVILWPILFAGPRVGVFHSVSGATRAKRWLVAFDLGIGL